MCVRDRRIEHLADVVRGRLPRELQHAPRFLHVQAADLVQQEAHLVRRDARVLDARPRLPGVLSVRHHFTVVAFSAACAEPPREWPLKIRVIANSPSLCPTMDSEM